MDSKERALTAIQRREPDRVPLEGVAWGEWSYPFLLRLLNHFGITDETHGLIERQDRLAEKLSIDFRPVRMEPSAEFKKKAVNNPLFHYSWGIPVNSETLEDEWGVRRVLNSTRLQSRIVHHPLRGRESLEGYSFPDPETPGRFDTAERLLPRWRDRYAVSASPGGDVFFSQAWYLRGFTELIRDMYVDPGFVEALFDGLLHVYLKACNRFADLGVDIVCLADDVAMQTGMIVSASLWRRYVKPRMKTLIDAVKRKGVYILFHTDGNCEAIIPDLIEVGVDILNPVQPECMDPTRIKRLYGDELTLSGTISLQRTLPYGTIQDVRKEVATRIKTCGHNGGLIIAPSNQTLLDTRIENFIAVYEAAKEYGRYPLTM